MNSTQQTPTAPATSPCADCNLEAIEKLTCTARRFGRQAEVMTEVADDLETYRKQYKDARKKYTDARDAATTELETIGRTLNDMLDQLRCRLTDRQRQCVDEAADQVFHDIEACSEPYGCHSPCKDLPAPDPDAQTDVAALAADIAARRAGLAECDAYFTALVGEPDEIAERVAKLKADTAALVAEVTAGGDASKAVRWYMEWVILDHWATLDRIGHGFDSVGDYLDCLCGVLMSLVSGWTAVAVLEGRKSELDCHAAAEKGTCDAKKLDNLTAIQEAYEVCEKKYSSSTRAA